MIILLGGGGAGKTTIQNELVKRGYKKGIIYTTRKKREGELHGREYMFINENEFEYLETTNSFCATTNVGKNKYAIHKDFCSDDMVFVANIEMIEKLKKNSSLHITTIYIDTTDEQRKERLQKRGTKKEEIEEKLQRNNIYQEAEKRYANIIIQNDDVSQAVEKIISLNQRKVPSEIIDAHSHIGYDYKFGTSKLSEYIDFCKRNGITVGNLMPQPNPAYTINGNVVPCMTWEYNDGRISYDTYNHKSENPYKYINYYHYYQCRNIKGITINFIPLVHPILDRIEYLEEMINIMKPNAIKLHGIGGGFGPKDIPKQFIEFIKKYNIPIITHIECDTRKDTNHSEQKKYIKSINNAYDWARFFTNNRITGILTHGLALDERAINIIRNNPNIMIGIGPDLLISKQPHRLNTQDNSSSYLQMLKEKVPVDQIVFDVDYNWNINPEDNKIDNDSIKRILSVWNKKEEQEKIFSQNIKKLYNRNKEILLHNKGER